MFFFFLSSSFSLSLPFLFPTTLTPFTVHVRLGHSGHFPWTARTPRRSLTSGLSSPALKFRRSALGLSRNDLEVARPPSCCRRSGQFAATPSSFQLSSASRSFQVARSVPAHVPTAPAKECELEVLFSRSSTTVELRPRSKSLRLLFLSSL